MSRADYLQQLKALLPMGLAWSRQPLSWIVQLLDAWAEALARVDLRCDALANEADPRTTVELLADWERVAGLPDPCVSDEQSLAQRQAALTSKLTSTGGQSRAYFIELAADMGYPGATIEEFEPMTCNDTCNDSLYSEADRFCWQINLPGSTGGLYQMTCNDTCNDALQSWGDEAVECRIKQFKPAHTNVIFAYP